MRAFVTGATGCLGRHLCVGLLRAGWAVTGTGRNEEAAQWLRARDIDFLASDLTDLPSLVRAMRGCDVVFHCGALSSAWGAREHFVQANVHGTQNTIQAARRTGVGRLVFVSSTSVYFDFRDRFDIGESEPLPRNAVNAYAWTKREAERVVQAVNDVAWVILRPRGIIGAYDNALIPRLALAADRGIIPLPNGGSALVDVTCVDNLVDALISAGSPTRAVSGQIFNVSNGTPVQVRDLLQQALAALDLSPRLISLPRRPAVMLAQALDRLRRLAPVGAEPAVTAYSLGLLAYSQTLDISKARRELGYLPMVPIEEGIRQAATWWCNEQET